MLLTPISLLMGGTLTLLIMIGRKGGGTVLDLERIRSGLAREEAVARDLDLIDAGDLPSLVATFAGSAAALERATSGMKPVTDDWPIMEYPTHSTTAHVRIAASLFDMSDLETWCPDCFAGGSVIPELWELPHLQAAFDAYYQSDRFLDRQSDPLSPTHWGEVGRVLRADPCAVESLRANGYFTIVFAEWLKKLPRGYCRENATEPAH